MLEIRKKMEESVEFLKDRTSLKPKVGFILGTGLSKVAEIFDDEVVIPYDEIPHFPTSTVKSHMGNLVVGYCRDVPVIVMQGRVHYYEGYSMKQVTYPIRVMKGLGVDTVVLSSAVGALNPLFHPGDIMLTVDQINLMGDNPLIGPNDDELGPRFPDMSRAFDPELRKLAEETALRIGMRLVQGIFVGLAGPSLETAAEYRFLRTIGADVVGMGTVPEVIAAVHASLKVLSFAIITDMCLPDALVPTSLEEILKVAGRADEKLAKLYLELIPGMKK